MITVMNTQKIVDNTDSERRTQYLRYVIVSISIVTVTAVVFIAMYLAAVKRIQYLYTNQTYQSALELKKTAVCDTVEKLATEIDQLRDLRINDETGLLRGLAPAVRVELTEAGEDASALRRFFSDNSALSEFNVIVYDNESGGILVDSAGLTGESGRWTGDLADAFVIMESVSAGGMTAVYGIRSTAFDAQMLDILSRRLAISSEEEGTVYWVDRMTALDNGNVSRVRVLDPLNPGRVGMALDKGGVGNGPDCFATEGLLDLEPGSQLVAKEDAEWTEADGRRMTVPTITCSQYYKPYSWAICGAFRLDLVGVGAVNSQEVARKATIRLGIRLALVFAAILAIAVFLILRNSARYFNFRHRRLRDQVERDALTGANTRAYGQQLLREAFARFEKNSEASPVLMVLDVDKFKSINDTWGHDIGDVALKHVVKAATKVMRGRDCVIRWGGDEFIAVMYRLEHARSEAVANRLRKAIGDTQVKSGDQSFQVTVSVGVTWFRFGDADYTEALKRADTALYQSKELGRNRVCVAETE